MKKAERLNLIAFTDTSLPYRNFQLHSKIEIKFCSDLDVFFHEALSNEFSGMILEMKKVMSTPARERDKIFTLAANQPLMRARIHKDIAIFVDDPDRFLTDCVQKNQALIRQHERVDVNLEARISRADDYAMASEFNAKIINISETGCYLITSTDFSESHLINIKLNILSNKLPICGGLRWKTIPKSDVYGYGIQFMKIQPDQSVELLNRVITPKLSKKRATEVNSF